MKTKENLKNNNFTKLTRSGISLIVLVITIIVIIILAAAIILSLNNNNPIMESNTARYESDRANMQAVFTNTVAKVMAKNQATVSVSAGQINTITGGVKEVEGEVAYTLTDAQNASNSSGKIVFDKQINTDTTFYTGKKLPIYPAGDTKWYVDEEGNISLEVAGTIYGSGEVVEGGNGGSDEPEVDPNAVAFAIYSETDNSLRFYKQEDVPSVGEQYNGKIVSAVYEDIETTNYKVVFDEEGQPTELILPGWNSLVGGDGNISNATQVVFEDKISPISTSYWFASLGYNQNTNETKVSHINFTNLDTSNVTDMSWMFMSALGLEVLNMSGLNTSNVTNMEGMFISCENLKSLNLSDLNTSNVTNMSNMFGGCTGLVSAGYTDENLLFGENFDTSKVTNMQGMFGGNYSSHMSLEKINISGFDMSSVTNMEGMFEACSKITSVGHTNEDLVFDENFNTSNVTSMEYLFIYCYGLKTLDLRSFDTNNVENFFGMFFGCRNIESINLSSFRTGNATNMQWMFYACSGLTELDISSFDTSNVTNMQEMFYECESLSVIYASEWWDVSNVTESKNMFYLCSGFDSYTAAKADKTYANYETGYFTYKAAPTN